MAQIRGEIYHDIMIGVEEFYYWSGRISFVKMTVIPKAII